ncbi:MAG TPA: hypothetical protein PK140_17510 [Polyangiaceae bacterium]|nr:hypothetical protein [Polyangiaceae bacterium]HQF25138.1 hypothetical protein [Polyangiaceae bacterium]HQM11204.1 hypothetical protein [Polyangiaceae bacterium]
MKTRTLEQRLEALEKSGVRIIDPRQTYIGEDVPLERVAEGVVLHPGVRLHGSKTRLGARAEVGTEGPATLMDTVMDEEARVASGYVHGAVLLKKASLGANAHVRAGTLLEEEASTAHAVGLKQTLLLSFVTLGSLINFCDCLMTGGTSRSDHAEVGSGYIHFNFTPWGKHGDKATPSLIGSVPRGVFLRERRIFLGGTGGLVGPAEVGFGAVAGAGQVVRHGIAEGHLVLQQTRPIDRAVEFGRLDAVMPRAEKNIRYIGHLHALRVWYDKVRLFQCPPHRKAVFEAALELLDGCIEERCKQLGRFLEERGRVLPVISAVDPGPCPLPLAADAVEDHIAWVRSLTEEQVMAGSQWLEGVVEGVSRPAISALA